MQEEIMTKRKGESEEDFKVRRREYEKIRDLSPKRIAWKAKYEPMRRAKPERKSGRKIYDERFRSKPKAKDYLLRWSYGITLAQYDAMYSAQNGVCAICGQINKNGRRLSVDHCHTSKKVRGLLCMQCNMLLGHARDSMNVLSKAIFYLGKWQ